MAVMDELAHAAGKAPWAPRRRPVVAAALPNDQIHNAILQSQIANPQCKSL